MGGGNSVRQTLFHPAVLDVGSVQGGLFRLPAVADLARVQVRPAVGAGFIVAHLLLLSLSLSHRGEAG